MIQLNQLTIFERSVFRLIRDFQIKNMESKWEKYVGKQDLKLFSCSTQLSTKFQLLTNTKILTNKEVSRFKSLRCCIYHANKC